MCQKVGFQFQMRMKSRFLSKEKSLKKKWNKPYRSCVAEVLKGEGVNPTFKKEQGGQCVWSKRKSGRKISHRSNERQNHGKLYKKMPGFWLLI